MEDDYSTFSLNSPASPKQSPLNTAVYTEEVPGCSRQVESENEENGYEIPSYQTPTEKARGHGDRSKDNARKRKASEALNTKAKVQKTENSIRKLKEHLDKKTCPKALRYSARANIPANEQFRKDTKSVKEKAERNFLEALKAKNQNLTKNKLRLAEITVTLLRL